MIWMSNYSQYKSIDMIIYPRSDLVILCEGPQQVRWDMSEKPAHMFDNTALPLLDTPTVQIPNGGAYISVFVWWLIKYV